MTLRYATALRVRMDPTAWTRKHLFAAAAIALLSAAIAATSAAGIVGWLVAALLTAGAGSGAATLGALLPVFVLGVLVGGPLAVVAAVGVGYALASRAARALRLSAARRLRRLARDHPIADRFLEFSAWADEVDPRTAEERAEARIARHKERYVAGEIGERTFERRVRAVLDDEGVYDRLGSTDARIESLLDADGPLRDAGDRTRGRRNDAGADRAPATDRPLRVPERE